MDRAACHGSEHPPPPPDRPLAARGPGRKPWHILGENGWRILTENLQPALPRRRPAARHPNGQRRALLLDRPPWPVRDERLVDPPRDRPTAHPAESSGRERRPRTDAPHAEGRDDPAARPHAPRPAAPLSALPHGVQSR